MLQPELTLLYHPFGQVTVLLILSLPPKPSSFFSPLGESQVNDPGSAQAPWLGEAFLDSLLLGAELGAFLHAASLDSLPLT